MARSRGILAIWVLALRAFGRCVEERFHIQAAHDACVRVNEANLWAASKYLKSHSKYN